MSNNVRVLNGTKALKSPQSSLTWLWAKILIRRETLTTLNEGIISPTLSCRIRAACVNSFGCKFGNHESLIIIFILPPKVQYGPGNHAHRTRPSSTAAHDSNQNPKNLDPSTGNPSSPGGSRGLGASNSLPGPAPKMFSHLRAHR